MESDSIIWAPKASLNLGWDSRKSQVVGCCFDPNSLTPESAIDSNSPLEASYTLEVIENSERLASALDVSASLAVEAPTGLDGDATVEFVRNHSFDENSVYALIKLEVKTETVALNPAQQGELVLLPDAADLLKNSPLQFLDKFGDSMICGTTKGAALRVLMELQSSTEDEKDGLNTMINGSVATATGITVDMAAKFKGELTALSKNRSLQCRVFWAGGPTNIDWSLMDLDQIFDNASKFEQSLADRSLMVHLTAELMPYNTLPCFTKYNMANVQNIVEQLNNYGEVQFWIDDSIALLQYMNGYSKLFPTPLTETQVRDGLEALNNATDYIKNLYNETSQLNSLAAADVQTAQDLKAGAKLQPSVTLIESLPPRWSKLPTSAQDLMDMLRDPTTNAPPKDGEYILFLDKHDAKSDVRLYCMFPKSTDDWAPRTYITLPTGGGQNCSVWPSGNWDGGKQKWRQGTTITTTYHRVAFDPMSMTVSLTDRTFAQTDGGPLNNTNAFDNGTSVDYTFHDADYATASASNVASSRQPFSTLNVDLSGTDFEIDPDTKWVDDGSFDLKLQVNKDPKDYKNRVCEIAVGGASARYLPKAGLKLRKAISTPATQP